MSVDSKKQEKQSKVQALQVTVVFVFNNTKNK